MTHPRKSLQFRQKCRLKFQLKFQFVGSRTINGLHEVIFRRILMFIIDVVIVSMPSKTHTLTNTRHKAAIKCMTKQKRPAIFKTITPICYL